MPLLVRTRAADRIGAMFDRIARRYDVINRLLSLQRDQTWRRLVAQLVLNSRPRNILDIATGTADLPLMIASIDSEVQLTGIDIAVEMLARGQKKIYRQGLSDQISLTHGDALSLPLASESVDAVTIAFGIRNMNNYYSVLYEIFRILRPAGSLTILEFSLPPHPFIRTIYLVYFRHLLPIIGGLISGQPTAYHYLNQSVESFPSGQEFCTLMKRVGFENPHFFSLTFGIASIYRARKPS